jgi:serine phosphatase RsbU (regulator of sigma subunit)/CheY-like chemotaxis protein/anti-sigma regulatory factor (Ser/Thr protein kinase)
MAATLSGGRAGAGAGPEPPLAIAGPPQARVRTAGPPASILLVDDDERSLRALAHVLEPLGQKLVSARSGEEALRWLLREEFAVILLDMRMPGLDGLQTARYINARTRTRHIPIIFLTAHGSDVEQVFGAHAAGAVDYVSKPFEPDLLRSKVAVFVELHRARAQHVREARARAEAEGIASTVSRLQSISDAALAHLELGELLPELLRRAAAVFSARSAGLLLGGEDGATLTVLGGEHVQDVTDARRLSRVQELLRPALEGAAINVPVLPDPSVLPSFPALPDAAAASAAAAAAAGAPAAGAPPSRAGSMIAAPLTTGTPFGALYLACEHEHGFTDEDTVVLALGAERAAIAIEHALSYERERGLVERLQDHLLPDRLPLIPGLEMAARYRPSERLTQVGGDWYDAIPLPDGRVGLVIGDVVGHGVGAAALMAELRAALRAYAIADPRSPARAIASLNALVAGTHGRMVATMLYLVVDAEGTGFRLASAGHPPPLLVRGDGRARFLPLQGTPPLGVAPHSRYGDFGAELAPGSTLLLYTDGLIERRDEPMDAGQRRLAGSLADAPADLEGLCAHVLESAADGAGFEDDTALLALRRLHAAVPEVLEMTLPAEPASVAAARRRLRAWLADGGLGPSYVFDVTAAASEACTNAVEHAYGPAPDATFRLTAERSRGGVVVRVSDHGAWRAPRGRGRGRGLRVIGELMDEIDVRRAPVGTTVEMRKRDGAHGHR